MKIFKLNLDKSDRNKARKLIGADLIIFQGLHSSVISLRIFRDSESALERCHPSNADTQ